MSLKIIVDKPADGGNTFLCPNCINVVVQEFRGGQAYLCSENRIRGPIRKEITRCSEYEPRNLYYTDASKELARLKMQAWYIEPSKERDGEFVFLTKTKWDAY